MDYLKKNPTALKLLIAMMEAGFGAKETRKLLKQVGKTRYGGAPSGKLLRNRRDRVD